MIWFLLCERMGLWMLRRALSVLPAESTQRVAVVRGLREQREYERYEAYCWVSAVTPYNFYKWREARCKLEKRLAKAHA